MGSSEQYGLFGAGRGRRSRRGDVRAAALLLLEESPRNGYQLIQEIEQRSSGAWRPSPGSIYPVLSQLEDEGVVAVAESASGRTYQLTDAGRAHLAERRDTIGVPWETAAASVSEPQLEIRQAARQVMGAVRQVMHAGSEEQVKSAGEILRDARRKLYRILADDESSS